MIVLTHRIEAAGTVTGTLTLDVDSRIKSRLRVTLDDGREAGLMLERGHLLRGGELLADAEGKQVVRVLAAAERVSTVRCQDPHLLARAAYHLGNRHVALQVGDGWLRLLDDYVLKAMLEQLGATVEAIEAPFQPEHGAYGGGHHHSHHGEAEFNYAPRLHQFGVRR